MNESKLAILETHIEERAARLGLSVNIEKLKYAQQLFLGGIEGDRHRALHVGVGHGHDMTRLLRFLAERLSQSLA